MRLVGRRHAADVRVADVRVAEADAEAAAARAHYLATVERDRGYIPPIALWAMRQAVVERADLAGLRAHHADLEALLGPNPS